MQQSPSGMLYGTAMRRERYLIPLCMRHSHFLMKASFSLLLLILFSLVTTSNVFGQSECEAKREHVSRVFMERASTLRYRMEEVDRTQLLSDETRSDFHWDAEWIIAWFTDQVERLEATEGCEGIASIVKAAHLQWDPVQLKSRKIRATVVLWYLDQVLLDLEEGNTRERLNEARSLFTEASQVQTGMELHNLLQRAVFQARQGLRLLRKSAIME